MESQSKNWKITKLIKDRSKIDPRPQYQRTPVWPLERKQLLIDSILSGYDLPKIYLRKLNNNPHYNFEVADGQQRLNAVWEFSSSDSNEKFSINKLMVDGILLNNVSYETLPADLKRRFDNYLISVSIIENASPTQIRTLFARLQMGVGLNPAELRHAIASNIGVAIDAIVRNLPFFSNKSGIVNNRYKHQDYIDRVISLIYYQNKRDLKAPLLRQLYTDLSAASTAEIKPYVVSVYKILKWMDSINKVRPGIFKKQWIFVDVFNFLHHFEGEIEDVKAKAFADSFAAFEKKRIKFGSKANELIEDKKSENYDPELYDYIEAFNKQAGLKGNIEKRLNTLIYNFHSDVFLKFKK